MDPDETLRLLREAITAHEQAITLAAETDAGQQVVDAARALDAWLRSGGFPPADWMTEVQEVESPQEAADREARLWGRATGSVAATVTYETRHEDGTLTTDRVGRWSRCPAGHPAEVTCPICRGEVAP